MFLKSLMKNNKYRLYYDRPIGRDNMVSTRADLAFSIILLPITAFALGFTFFLTSINIWMFPSILIAMSLFGLSCMGLKRVEKYKKLGETIGEIR